MDAGVHLIVRQWIVSRSHMQNKHYRPTKRQISCEKSRTNDKSRKDLEILLLIPQPKELLTNILLNISS